MESGRMMEASPVDWLDEQEENLSSGCAAEISTDAAWNTWWRIQVPAPIWFGGNHRIHNTLRIYIYNIVYCIYIYGGGGGVNGWICSGNTCRIHDPVTIGTAGSIGKRRRTRSSNHTHMSYSTEKYVAVHFCAPSILDTAIDITVTLFIYY